MADEDQRLLKWGDKDQLNLLVSGLAEIGAGAKTFEALVSAQTPEQMLDKLMQLNTDDLRRVVLARVVLEQRQRATAAKS